MNKKAVIFSSVLLSSATLFAKEIKPLAHRPFDEGRGILSEDATGKNLGHPQPVQAWTNQYSIISLSRFGQISSIKERATDKELLKQVQPFAIAKMRDGRRIISSRIEKRADGNWNIRMRHKKDAIVLSIKPFDAGLSFRIISINLKDIESLDFARISPVCNKWIGSMANLLSDEESGVALRAYDLPLEMNANKTSLYVRGTPKYGIEGMRAGICAGPKKSLPKMLRSMEKSANVPYSISGGAYSLESQATRGSYLFADLRYASTEEWIRLAKRGGFSTIHIHGWWSSLGHYPINKNYFPDGIQDLRKAVEKIHAAGLRAGIHTLTACIQTDDPWLKGDTVKDLLAWQKYTLVKEMSPADTEIVIKEKPIKNHDLVFTYSGNGNAIRIGKEIIQYDQISSKPPYTFRVCRRGAFGTKPAAHHAGDSADYLQQRYLAFYPDPDKPLADELAECIANVFHTCNLDQLYFDGSEGMMSRYGIDAMRRKIFQKILDKSNGTRRDIVAEASCHGAHSWWFHSRLGAWDHPVWAAKRFHDRHIESVVRVRETDLLGPQLGWWAPRIAGSTARGHFLDEMEYFACKNVGVDGAMSIQGINVSWAPLPSAVEKQITVMGWYERFRLARAFDPEAVKRIAVPGEEFRLRQDDRGVWQFRPVGLKTRRFENHDQWRFVSDRKGNPEFRMEALFSTTPYEDAKAVSMLSPSQKNQLMITTARDTSLNLKTIFGPEKRDVLVLQAKNKSAVRRGAWTAATLNIPHPYLDLKGNRGFGFWVKGDGKGAVLNVQVKTPREYFGGLSDHCVHIDFTGWKYVRLLFRERDVEESDRYLWPYHAGIYNANRNALDLGHISNISIYLNEIPGNGQTEIQVSEIRSLPVLPVVIENPVITINQQKLIIPFKMNSGDFVESENGLMVHYDQYGELKGTAPLNEKIVCNEQDNLVQWDSADQRGGAARAELTLFLFSDPFPALRSNVTAKENEKLSYESMVPIPYVPEKNVTEMPPLKIRPREHATVTFELDGCAEKPALKIGNDVFAINTTLREKERLLCEDGKRWKVLDRSFRVLKEGELEKPVGIYHSVVQMSFTTANPKLANLKIKIIKQYR